MSRRRSGSGIATTFAVTGIGMTAMSRRSGRSVQAQACEAAAAACVDAGVAPDDVDSVIPLGGYLTTEDLIAGIGLPDSVYDATPGPGGNAPVASVRLAEVMIAGGAARHVLAVVAKNGASEARIADRVTALPGQEFRRQLERPQGWTSPAEWYAMLCRRYMIEHGITKDHLAAVALAAYDFAQSNPRAMMNGRPLTRAMYDASPMIAEPYQLYDCCQETDGAVAVLLSAVDAIDRTERAVPVLGASTARPQSPDDLSGRENWELIGLHTAAPIAFERAGVGPDDMSAAMVYDCFTFELIHQLEAAGFCPPGEGGPFVASGAIARGGRLPVNTHGGLLAEGHMSGMGHIVEAVRQLRGEAGANQLDDPRHIAVTGWGDWGDGSLVVLGSPARGRAA